MKKIVTLFQRNYETDHLVRDEVTPGAEWVLAGEGVATVKIDGTAVMIKDGELYKRFDAKQYARSNQPAPEGFIPEQDPDPQTFSWPGWVECDRSNPADRWMWEAFDLAHTIHAQVALPSTEVTDGTYEAVGPKIQKNPEQRTKHFLLRHGDTVVADAPRTYEALCLWFVGRDIEGLVWHHPDGRMVKIKKRDFGMRRTE